MTPVRLKINNYKSALKSKQLSAIVENIIASFPLTLVNLERIRNEINKLNIPFWVKDEQGKYLLVNEKFASNFHLTPSQVEGKPVEKFIPEYLIHFSKALQAYIKESGSVIIIEGFPWSGTQTGENNRVIEIPVLSPEGNLNAIIGIALESNEDASGELTASLAVLKNFLKNYLLINNENKIIDAGEEFCNTFSLNINEIKDKLFKSDFSGIPVIISTVIDEFIDSGEKNKSLEIKIPHLHDYNFKLHFVKGKDDEILLIVEKTISSNGEGSAEVKSYDSFIDNLPEPVIIYGKEDLKFLSANEPALQLYGYTKEEFLQLDLTDLYSPDDIQTLAENSDEKNSASVQHKQKRKDGKNVFVEIRKKIINYNDKPAYLNIIRDVTEQLSLEADGKIFNSLFDNSSDLIFITDKDGFIKSINNSASVHLHLENAEGTTFTSLLIDEERGKINSALFKSDLKEKISFETFLKKSSGEALKINLTAVPLTDFNKGVESYTIICSPAEKEEIVKEIIKEVPVEKINNNEIASEIPELNFLSDVFHDMLTPINVILGFVQDLTENIENPTSEQEESLKIINQNKENLITLLNHIIDFVQYEKGNIKIELNRIKIIDIIEDLKYELENKKIISELAFGKISSSLEITTDKEKLLRTLILLVHLISKTAGEKKLYISAEFIDKENFGICLKDNYNTPSESFVEKCVELFTNAKKIKIPGIPSVTVNLILSSLNILQGSFRLLDKDKPAFVFPIKLKEVIDVEEIASVNKENTDEKIIAEEINEVPEQEDVKDEKIKTPIDLSQLSCLYIEDQIDSQMLFSMQMKELKEIHFAVSLEQAIPLLKKNKYDFLIVDINLQGDYNGLDILKIVRTMPGLETTPVIAVTAYQLPSDRENYLLAGFTDFISKPLLKENLLKSLERTLEFQP